MSCKEFQSVIQDEYSTLFSFYVYQLDFQYIEGDIAHINRHIKVLEQQKQNFKVIDKVQCGHDYIVYIDER